MNATELTVLIPLTLTSISTAIVVVINATKSRGRDARLDVIQEQTNGATAKLLERIAEQAVEIGRLQGMVQGLQTQRGQGRATDQLVLPPPAEVPPVGTPPPVAGPPPLSKSG